MHRSPIRAHAHTRAALAALATVALSAGAASAQTPQRAPEVRLELVAKGGFSPYTVERYVLRLRPGSGTLAVERRLPGDYPDHEQIRLLTPDGLKAAHAVAARCPIEAMTPAPRPTKHSAARVWRVLYRSGAADATLTVADPEHHDDPRYADCIDAVRTLAAIHVGAGPFRDVFFEPGNAGLLSLHSFPEARVLVDGVELGASSPVRDVPVGVGEHEVTFINEAHNLRRTYTVKVMPSMTTLLDVDLR